MSIEEIHTIFLDNPVIFTDSRKINGPGIFVALKGPQFDGNRYAEDALNKGASMAIVDDILLQSLDERIIYVNDALELLQKLAAYHRSKFTIPVIALTGSNGKTTTKELLNSVLSQKYTVWATPGNFNNHIGVPLTLLQLKAEHEIAIIEMGASALKEIEFLSHLASPTEGLITNIGLAHVEGFGGEENILIGKTELYEYLKSNNSLIYINTADTRLKGRLGAYESYFSYSLSELAYTATNHLGVKVNYDHTVSLIVQERSSDDVVEIHSNLTGEYNAINIVVAIAAGLNHDLNLQQIKAGIESYVSTNNRSQIVEYKGFKIILDAYNANPTSMKAALKSVQMEQGRVGVILGAMKELGPDTESYHRELIENIRSSKIHRAVFIGSEFPVNDVGDRYLDYSEALSNKLWEQFKDVDTILIKGSRSEQLEKLVDL